jgi:hypothetical protein
MSTRESRKLPRRRSALRGLQISRYRFLRLEPFLMHDFEDLNPAAADSEIATLCPR